MSGVMTGGDDRLRCGERRVAELINGANLRPSKAEEIAPPCQRLQPTLTVPPSF